MATETETAGTLIPRDSLANRLVLIRRELGLSQREAAMRCGVGFGSWQSWENGSSPRNELRKLSQVAEELHVDRDWLLFGGNLRPEEWETAPEPGERHKRPHYQHQLPDWTSQHPPSADEVRSFLRRTPLVRETDPAIDRSAAVS